MSSTASPWWIRGLSPRVRGNLLVEVPHPFRPRSIPARAGEPSATGSAWTSWTVYPRACGGTTGYHRVSNFRQGLSPRVRGNQHRILGGADLLGSIPARAGEPLRRTRLRVLDTVYPRACGGTINISPHIDIQQGLSPRVRGNLVIRLDMLPIVRSIPARAGEPRVTFLMSTGKKVYPRACGGTIATTMNMPMRVGLSPRVRGNRIDGNAGLPAGRSIPARAGEPLRADRAWLKRRVYPRACGGT